MESGAVASARPATDSTRASTTDVPSPARCAAGPVPNIVDLERLSGCVDLTPHPLARSCKTSSVATEGTSRGLPRPFDRQASRTCAVVPSVRQGVGCAPGEGGRLGSLGRQVPTGPGASGGGGLYPDRGHRAWRLVQTVDGLLVPAYPCEALSAREGAARRRRRTSRVNACLVELRSSRAAPRFVRVPRGAPPSARVSRPAVQPALRAGAGVVWPQSPPT